MCILVMCYRVTSGMSDVMDAIIRVVSVYRNGIYKL